MLQRRSARAAVGTGVGRDEFVRLAALPFEMVTSRSYEPTAG